MLASVPHSRWMEPKAFRISCVKSSLQDLHVFRSGDHCVPLYANFLGNRIGALLASVPTVAVFSDQRVPFF